MPEHGGKRPPSAGSPADWRRMTGVGCFGKPAILIQVLQRIMARYGRIVEKDLPMGDAAWRDGGAGSLSACLSKQMQTSAHPLPDGQPRVAGFFIYLEDGRPQIQVLTQYGWSRPAWRS